MDENEDTKVEERSILDKLGWLFIRLILLVWGVTCYYSFFLSE